MAQYNLGIALENGLGFAEDKPQAIHWYEKAAQQQFGPAIRSLSASHSTASVKSDFFFQFLVVDSSLVRSNEFCYCEISGEMATTLQFFEDSRIVQHYDGMGCESEFHALGLKDNSENYHPIQFAELRIVDERGSIIAIEPFGPLVHISMEKLGSLPSPVFIVSRPCPPGPSSWRGNTSVLYQMQNGSLVTLKCRDKNTGEEKEPYLRGSMKEHWWIVPVGRNKGNEICAKRCIDSEDGFTTQISRYHFGSDGCTVTSKTVPDCLWDEEDPNFGIYPWTDTAVLNVTTGNIIADTKANEGLDNSEKQADIKRLMVLIGAGDLGIQVRDQILALFKKSLPLVPDFFWESIEREIDPDSLVALVIPIYSKHLSHDDIKEMIRFYETPTGMRIVKSLPLITQESMQLGQKWGEDISKKALQKLQQNGYK